MGASMYYVIGGRFKDTHFQDLISRPEEYGPFESYEEAFEEWRARMFAQIDDSHFRLFVTQHPETVIPERKRA